MKKIAEPFSNAFINVMPQIGMSDIRLESMETCGKNISAPGVVVVIGLVGQLHGNVMFAMSEEIAVKIASIMMCMEVESLDDMAQSAISELSNMLAANACTGLSAAGINAEISTPTLMYGIFHVNTIFDHVVQVKMQADGMPFDIYVALEQKM